MGDRVLLTTSESRAILNRDQDDEPTGSTEYDVDEPARPARGYLALLVRSRRVVDSPDGVETFENAPPKPLLRASRALRVAAVIAIPTLIEQLQQAAEATISRVEQAKKIADSLK